MSKEVKIGTCGFGRTPKPEYFEKLDTVEIQHIFYQPPQIKTLEKWREEMPEGFECTLKAWQLITHATKSPTYKRLKRELSETEFEEAGYFRPTPIVLEGWETTLASAKALNAKTVLFQCPASLKPTDEHFFNINSFFSTVDRGGMNFCWEPRGKDWSDELVKTVCDEHDLWHAVDPLERRTVTPERCYFRLHGREGWRYKYEEEELEELASMLPDSLSYVFFNNREMFEDAQRFREIVGRD